MSRFIFTYLFRRNKGLLDLNLIIGRLGTEVKSLWSPCAGPHTCYKGNNKEHRRCKPEEISKISPSSDCLLKLEGMKMKSLVIVN